MHETIADAIAQDRERWMELAGKRQAEIERLRDAGQTISLELFKSVEENERLRTALKLYIGMPNWDRGEAARKALGVNEQSTIKEGE